MNFWDSTYVLVSIILIVYQHTRIYSGFLNEILQSICKIFILLLNLMKAKTL